MNRTIQAITSAALAAFFFSAGSVGAADAITSEQANDILQELKAIRKALEQRPAMPMPPQNAAAPQAPVNENVSIAFPSGGYAVGRVDAPVTLVEYTDYQCPFCQRFHNDAFAQIKANYVDTGKVRYVSRDYPLPFHENAKRAAIAARCAGEQGKFWELRHQMIVNANALQADKILTYAANVELDVPKFKACTESDKYTAAVDRDIAEGSAAGVSGTPSFVIGRVDKDRLEGVRVVGAMPYAQFDAKLKEALAKSGAK